MVMNYRITLWNSYIGEFTKKIELSNSVDVTDFLADYLAEHPITQDGGGEVNLIEIEILGDDS